ncbi:MAG: 8-amino-7-oxononanoate synthase [Verrucomicrobia bacterium]|nr:MAG: 8-amino-7-oxononanoate synthase [Verrucomicrobiota bacterium]
MAQVGNVARASNEFLANEREYINFGSQDYLGRAQTEDVKDAAREVIAEFGVHSAGSPVLCGRTRLLVELERKLAAGLAYEACIIYPTAWMAGFGMLASLVRNVHEGSRHATPHVKKFSHNDLSEVEDLLKAERVSRPADGIFVVVESLYSMDSDSPDLAALLTLARKYEAIVLLDVAHDFGSMGATGRGILDNLKPGDDRPDVIMGSFSKTFGANGGFIVCSTAVRDYVSNHSPSHVFSNAISPIQTAVAHKSFDIVFSRRGDSLRSQLKENILRLRAGMEAGGMFVAGTPSPIVPVFVGDEKIARLTSRYLTDNSLLANLVEFPAVPRGKARFRFQVMATHRHEDIDAAARIMIASRNQAVAEWEFTPPGESK